jgi:hypothetical protein
MLLRVPPASIKALGEFGDLLKKRGGGKLAYNMVVTRIGFVAEEASPKLTFKPVGMLSDEAYELVKEVIQGDAVPVILGSGYAVEHVEPEAETPKLAPVVEKLLESKPEPKPAVKAKAKPEPKPEPVMADMEVSGLNLDDLNFDD